MGVGWVVLYYMRIYAECLHAYPLAQLLLKLYHYTPANLPCSVSAHQAVVNTWGLAPPFLLQPCHSAALGMCSAMWGAFERPSCTTTRVPSDSWHSSVMLFPLAALTFFFLVAAAATAVVAGTATDAVAIAASTDAAAAASTAVAAVGASAAAVQAVDTMAGLCGNVVPMKKLLLWMEMARQELAEPNGTIPLEAWQKVLQDLSS